MGNLLTRCEACVRATYCRENPERALSSRRHGSGGKTPENYTKVEYRRKADSRAPLQLAESPRITSAPVKYDELIQISVNRMLGITVPILCQNPTFSSHSSYQKRAE
jgi:hypothetical protein